MLTDFQRRISWCHFPEIRVFSNEEKAVIKMIFLIEDGMLTKFVSRIQQYVGIEFLTTDVCKDFKKIILWI